MQNFLFFHLLVEFNTLTLFHTHGPGGHTHTHIYMYVCM